MFRLALGVLALVLVATSAVPAIAGPTGSHHRPQGVSYATLLANYERQKQIKLAIEGTVIPADKPVRDRALKYPAGS